MLKFIVLFLISFPALADEWTSADTYREVAFDSILIVDYMQTRWFLKHSEFGYYEVNPLLGNKHPSADRVAIACVATGLLHYGIAKALPQDWRAGFQYVSIGFEGAVVAHNFQIGIKMDF